MITVYTTTILYKVDKPTETSPLYGLAFIALFVVLVLSFTWYLRFMNKRLSLPSQLVKISEETVQINLMLLSCFLAELCAMLAALNICGYKVRLSWLTLITVAITVPVVASVSAALALPAGKEGFALVASYLILLYALLVSASAGGYYWFTRKRLQET